MTNLFQIPDSVSTGCLSVAVMSPDSFRSNAAALALSECQNCQIYKMPSYPASLDEVPQIFDVNFDAVLIDLDGDPEYALDLVETIVCRTPAVVMVFSAKADSEMVMRCMRAGAREFLTTPFSPRIVADAMSRTMTRRPEVALPRKTDGSLSVFAGAKGGAGVTTLACNFAVLLAKELGKRTLLIDLNLPLGDAAINLGINPGFTTVDAFQNAGRLDPSFLSTLVTRHNTGLFVLAAPDQLAPTHTSHAAIDRLVEVARQAYDHVVVDAGRKLDLWSTKLYDPSATFYLVTQVGVPELRNANRLIPRFATSGSPRLEIVLNRYQTEAVELSDQQITRALTQPARWKVPNSFATVLRMQKTAIPLVMEDSPISRILREMAGTVASFPVAPVEKKRAFGFLRRAAAL